MHSAPNIPPTEKKKKIKDKRERAGILGFKFEGFLTLGAKNAIPFYTDVAAANWPAPRKFEPQIMKALEEAATRQLDNPNWHLS